jgi:hypothetical protein
MKKSRALKSVFYLALVLLAFAQSSGAHAAGRQLLIDDPSIGNFERMHRQQLEQNNYRPPAEPKFDKVTFLKVEPPRTLKESIDHLLYGIYVDTPPEYDHYGYEIRRYMANIAGMDVLADPARIEQELANIANARIIYEYWRKDLSKKISDISKAIEADPSVSPTMRSTFKYNSGVVTAFLTECRAWIDNNEAVLKFLRERQGQYVYKDPIITFDEKQDRLDFQMLYKAQQKALTEINEYLPFMVMVY